MNPRTWPRQAMMLGVMISWVATAAPAPVPTPAPSPGEEASAAQAPAGDSTSPFSSNIISVTNPVRLVLLPEMLPPSMTKASFDRQCVSTECNRSDSEYNGNHLEVVWEPSLATPLAKSVVLGPGKWQMSFFASPLQHPIDPFSDTSWSYFRFPSKPKENKEDPWLVVACAYRRVHSKASQGLPAGSGCESATETSGWALIESATETSGWALIKIKASVEELLTAEQLLQGFGLRGEASTPLPTSQRSFSEDSERAATDLARAVADVALEKLETAALEEVRQRLLAVLCQGQIEAKVNQAFMAVFVSSEEQQLLLARTCAALRSVRLQDLAAGSSLGLQQALKQDVAALGASLLKQVLLQCLSGGPGGRPEQCAFIGGALHGKEELAAAVGGLALLVHLAAQPESSGAALAQAQLIVKQLVEFIRADLKQQAPVIGRADVVRKGLILAGTALAICHASGACDSHAIRRILDTPEQFISGKASQAVDLKLDELTKNADYIALKGRLLSIITHGMAVMSPESRHDSRRAAMEASAMTFEMIELLAETRCSKPETRCAKELQELRDLRQMTDALLQQDVPQALVTAGGIAVVRLIKDGTATGSFERQVRHASALTSYLSSYSSFSGLGSPGPALSIEEQRKLRRQAISALVDLANDRSQQVGEWTWALTVTPSVRGYFIQRGREGNETRWDRDPGMHLSLPLAIAAEYVASEKLGLALQGSVIDIGQYSGIQLQGDSALAKPDRLSFVALGVGAGVTYNRWTLMLDGRYTPGWQVKIGEFQEEVDGKMVKRDRLFENRVTFGLTIGYQVPLLRIR